MRHVTARVLARRVIVCATAIILAVSANAAPMPKDHTCLLIVMDGLRPDYITPDLMPRLYAFSEESFVCDDHHSVFPTVTRLNATSFSTGAYPATHGILGNSIYVPEANPTAGISTGSADRMKKADEATGGKLITAVTLGELLQQRGQKLLIASSGSPGSAFLLNHKISGGAILNCELTLPASLEPRILQLQGPVPPETMPNKALNARAVDAYLKFGLDEFHPAVTILWISDPDHTAHESGIGSPLTNDALRAVDTEFGRILDTLKQKGLTTKVNVFVASDHGFATQNGPADIPALLIENKLKASKDSGDVIVAEGAIYVKNHDPEIIAKIVKLLQATPWAGAIFTKEAAPGSPQGVIPGTLSQSAIHWNHPRAGDILVSANWTDDANEFAYKGRTTLPGPAGHGTSSPYEIHNVLIAAGPEIKAKTHNPAPTGNIDLAPTLCFLNQIATPLTMNGRILHELLKDGPDPKSVPVKRQTTETQATNNGVRYHLTMTTARVANTDYLDSTKVDRTP
ncbi:MAG: alkaline phosphatase family protein [Candidatus Hydrogenedentes bacterium]|nr:alkaline phosphatase family protein [Candidatus Hydrogenedentota bacterium]